MAQTSRALLVVIAANTVDVEGSASQALLLFMQEILVNTVSTDLLLILRFTGPAAIVGIGTFEALRRAEVVLV